METLLLILAVIALVTGVAGCIVPMLPGPVLSYAGILLVHWSGYMEFSTTSLILWGVAMVVVSLLDFLLAPWMTKKFGGHSAGSWGSIIGMFAGMIFSPIGMLLGTFLGALIGEFIALKKFSGDALVAAFGSFLSFFVGTGIKLFYCLTLIMYIVFYIWN